MQDVIAAISTSPFFTLTPSAFWYTASRSSARLLKPFCEVGFENRSAKVFFTLPISMRSCGRFGPASEGATEPRSSATTVV